jgi:hypothetical protein
MKHSFTDKLEDSFAVRGDLTARCKDINGKVIHSFEEKNLVVNVAKNILVRLLAGEGPPISHIILGVDDASETLDDTTIGGLSLAAMPEGKNYQNSEFVAFKQPLRDFNFRTDNSVTFHWEIGYFEAVGLRIQEYGLSTTDGQLFSRKVRGLITKGDDIAIEGEWTLSFGEIVTLDEEPQQ